MSFVLILTILLTFTVPTLAVDSEIKIKNDDIKILEQVINDNGLLDKGIYNYLHYAY